MNNGEFLQREFFDRHEHLYHTEIILDPPLSQALELEDLENTLQLSKGKIIDFGCGSGRISMYFLRRGFNVIGVDVSSHSIQHLENLYQTHKTESWGKLETMTSLPINLVDGVVGADILHHIDMPSYLPKIYSLLKQGGRVAFSEPNGLHLPWYAYLWVKRIPWHVEEGLLKCTPRNVHRQLSKAGFQNIKINPHGLLPTFLFNRWSRLCRYNAFTMSRIPLLSTLSFRFIVEAQK